MSNTATAPKPAAPAKPKATEIKPAEAPASEAKVEVQPNSAPAPRGGNSAYADEETREQVTQLMAHLRAKGFTRPSISAVTGYSDSQVWRAQNGKVHADEVEALLNFAKAAEAGEIKPPTNGVRKPKPEALQAKIDTVIGKLAELDPKATAATLRKALAEVKELLEA
jgi:murein L,D-transpeptidase YcbB/YkuD